MRLSKPTGTIVRQEYPSTLFCGEEIITCGSESYTCGGRYITSRASAVTGTIVRQSEVV